MANLLDKFIGIMGFGDDDPEEDYENEILEEDPDFRSESKTRSGVARDQFSRDTGIKEAFPRDIPPRDSMGRRKAAVVSIHTQKQIRVMVIEPVSFEEAQAIAEHLKARKAVILNLERTEANLSQRIVDFISGTTYALGGNMQKVGNGIFLFVPNNVDISGELNYKSNDRELIWPKISN